MSSIGEASIDWASAKVRQRRGRRRGRPGSALARVTSRSSSLAARIRPSRSGSHPAAKRRRPARRSASNSLPKDARQPVYLLSRRCSDYGLGSRIVAGIRNSHQICGDGHLLNFGGFGTPENRFVFDVNDFDETTLGAWEWDVKRLVTSVIIAARHLKLAPSESRMAALQCIRAYRERVRGYAVMKVLEVWYDRLSEARLNEIVSSARTTAPVPRFGQKS